jgi:hypothetical protein
MMLWRLTVGITAIFTDVWKLTTMAQRAISCKIIGFSKFVTFEFGNGFDGHNVLAK